MLGIYWETADKDTFAILQYLIFCLRPSQKLHVLIVFSFYKREFKTLKGKGACPQKQRQQLRESELESDLSDFKFYVLTTPQICLSPNWDNTKNTVPGTVVLQLFGDANVLSLLCHLCVFAPQHTGMCCCVNIQAALIRKEGVCSWEERMQIVQIKGNEGEVQERGTQKCLGQ